MTSMNEIMEIMRDTGYELRISCIPSLTPMWEFRMDDWFHGYHVVHMLSEDQIKRCYVDLIKDCVKSMIKELDEHNGNLTRGGTSI